MRAAKDTATAPAAPSAPGQEGAPAEAEQPCSWDDPASQERLLAATAHVRLAATPMLVRQPSSLDPVLPCDCVPEDKTRLNVLKHHPQGTTCGHPIHLLAIPASSAVCGLYTNKCCDSSLLRSGSGA